MTLLEALCRLNGLIHFRKFRYSRPVEGNAATMGLSEKLWWGYKYFVRPVEKAERGKGIEEFFAAQDLSFAYDDGFVEDSSFTIGAGGDLLASHHIRPDTTSRLWDDVRGFYFGADLAYANLETPVVPSAAPSFVPKNILKAPPLNNTPEVFARIVDEGHGVNFFSTANNHCLDQGEAGLVATLDFLDSQGYRHFGTARSLTERDAVVMVEKGGMKLAFLSYTFSLNGKTIPEGKGYLANYVRLNRPETDLSLIRSQIADAKAAGADAIIACLHWSLEFESYPIDNVIKMGHSLIESGVDVIIGNHPHGVQPIESYAFSDPATGDKRRGLIIYALGDLLSCHEHIPNSRLGNLARIRLAKGRLNGRECARVASLEIMPTYLYAKMEGEKCVDFRVLDFQKLAAELHAGENRLGLDEANKAEIFRLEALLLKLLGPALKAPSQGNNPAA